METSQILYKRMVKDIDLHSCAASARVEGNKNGECSGHPTEMNLASHDAERRRQILGAVGEDAIWGKMKTCKRQKTYWL